MLGAGLSRDDVGDFVHQFRVPGRGQADGLGKHSGSARASNAMQCFVPVVMRRNVESFDCWRCVHHLRNFFFQRHARHQIVDAHLNRQLGVFVRWQRLRLTDRDHEK